MYDAFCAYAEVDERLKDRFLTATSSLKRKGVLRTWHFREVPAGTEWEPSIHARLRSSHAIFLLVSADFIASDYCYGIEMAVALERHATSSALVVPILVRPCDYSGTPLARLQMVPDGERAVTEWGNRDSAWTNVVQRLGSALDGFDENPPTEPSQRPDDGLEAPVTFFDVALSGGAVVPAQDELELAVRSVRDCDHSMRTISYRESAWWTSQMGRTYLDEQRKLVRRGGAVERIFILSADEPLRPQGITRAVMDEHRKAGVSVRFVHEAHVPLGYLAWVEDFILYDETLLRVSHSAPAELVGRDAHLYTDHTAIHRGIQWYQGLKYLSAEWEGQ